VLIKWCGQLLADRDGRTRRNQPKGNGLGQDLWWARYRIKDSRLKISPGIDFVTSHVVREVTERGLDSMERDLSRK
jgi:hypothetical protein